MTFAHARQSGFAPSPLATPRGNGLLAHARAPRIRSGALRLLTYLAPSIPADFFKLVADVITEATGIRVDLQFEQRISGPMPGDDDPLQDGSADVAFMCAPSFRWQRDRLDLLPVLVSTDPRAGGRPVYFSDVVVRRDDPARAADDLRGCRWAFNDRSSASGWFCMTTQITPAEPDAYFSSVIQAGSHLDSLRLIRDGVADAAAIDSNVLRYIMRDDPALLAGLRVLVSWGPFPIQPIVMRPSLPLQLRRAVRRALLRAHHVAGDKMERFGFSHFVNVPPAFYDR